jgi:preprotein translocase subunit SecA
MGFLDRIFGDWNDREIKRIEKIAQQVESFDKAMQALSDDELKAKTPGFKARLESGETLDDILPEAFAVCREAAWRVLGMKHFHVQIIGGIVLHEGNIAEMKTGEGKTLVATLPAYLNALAGEGVHVVTVNDYLARRDMEWMGRIYKFLGLSVGCVVHDVDHAARRAAYDADITYGTNNEFGFDYLRDNMVVRKEDQMQRPLNYAIIDEVDSILIDEARTPLIISGQGEKSTDLYHKADRFVRTLSRETDFTVDEKDRTVAMTEEGVAKCEKYFGIENFADPENMEINHHVQIALKAHYIMKRDVDYMEKDGEIVIVDEFTGRFMFGRRYSDGLHQAIEAKEGIEVRRESKTLATITLQNYFRMYKKLAGMTGTAKTEETEFSDIYNMAVVVIPTNKPVARIDLEDSVYTTERGKYAAILDDIVRRHETGQPLLVGTISVEKSEALSEMLKRRGVPHNVLNARQHLREAEIVAQAGRKGAVTIATNMAGRGTDILLGGNPEFEARRAMNAFVADEGEDAPEPGSEAYEAKYAQFLEKFKAERAVEQQEVIKAGGLHIIGTERHEARRIDNQLRGRSGRQGDPGSTQFFIALEDDLMRLFGGERMQMMMGRLGLEEGVPIEGGILTKTIENAQKKVEGKNYGIRKYVLQYDDVMNRQRTVIYNERNRVLQGEDLKEHILGMMQSITDELCDFTTADSKFAEEWDLEDLNRRIQAVSPALGTLSYSADELTELTPEKLREDVMKLFREAYDRKEEEIGAEPLRAIERMLLLRIVDNKWMDHIDDMDQLKTGIGLRSLGGQDPAAAYANEGSDMFDLMVKSICDDMVKYLLSVTVQTDAERRQVMRIGAQSKEETRSAFDDERSKNAAQRPQGPLAQAPRGPVAMGPGAVRPKMPGPPPKEMRTKSMPVKVDKKPGRNDPCPCGSGKKYKNCHGRNETV